jgi:hypothetical protein
MPTDQAAVARIDSGTTDRHASAHAAAAPVAAAALPVRPRLTAASAPLTREVVTLMTPGQEPELLTLGYLRNQRLVERFIRTSAVRTSSA